MALCILLTSVGALVAAGPGQPRTHPALALSPLGTEGIERGTDRLKRGQYALAESRFRVELEANPDSIPARRGLALANAAQRSCREAAPMLASLRLDGDWDAELARAEGNCAARSGDESLARAIFEEATQLDPNDAEAWYGLVQVSMPDPAIQSSEMDFEAALEGLSETSWTTSRVPVLVAVSAAWAAYHRGDDVEWALIELRRTLTSARVDTRAARVEADTLEGRLALDHGDPLDAERIFLRGLSEVKRAPRIGAWRAEALRRMGDAPEASRILESGRASRGEHWTRAVVEARVAADQGNFDAATAALAQVPEVEPEVLATRWYIAHRAGDGAAANRWQRRWAATSAASRTNLDDLRPWKDVTP
jgi:Tfp pilus assembly protein PilF